MDSQTVISSTLQLICSISLRLVYVIEFLMVVFFPIFHLTLSHVNDVLIQVIQLADKMSKIHAPGASQDGCHPEEKDQKDKVLLLTQKMSKPFKYRLHKRSRFTIFRIITSFNVIFDTRRPNTMLLSMLDFYSVLKIHSC